MNNYPVPCFKVLLSLLLSYKRRFLLNFLLQKKTHIFRNNNPLISMKCKLLSSIIINQLNQITLIY